MKVGDKAQEAANYFATHDWGKTEAGRHSAQPKFPTKEDTHNLRQIVEEDLEVYEGDIEMEGLVRVIKKPKRGKTVGPDSIALGFLKQTETHNLLEVLELLSEWWNKEYIPDNTMQARVVLIFKKGDEEQPTNYRPISLLNTFYKLLAAIIQHSIAVKLDNHLQKTQYGFRANRGTADAIQFIGRILDKGESTQTDTILFLVDWAKAFAKVKRYKLIEALYRIDIPDKIINMIKQCAAILSVASPWMESPQNGTNRKQE